LDYSQALYSLVKNAAGCLKAKAGSIRLLDKTGKKLEVAVAFGLSKNYLKKGPVEIEKSPIDKSALTGKIVQILDAAKDKRFQYPKEAKKEKIKSVLCILLKSKERPLGVLRVYTNKEHVFTKEEIAFVSTLANQGAAVIKNAQVYKRLKAINEIAKTITSQLDIHKVLDVICKSAVSDMAAKGASIMLIAPSARQLETAATYGLSKDFITKGPVNIDKSISDCLKGSILIIENIENDSRIQYPQALKKEGIKSIICVPFKIKGTAIGTLRIYTAYRYKLDKEDAEFINILADFSAVAIQNARLFEHIKSDYDSLSNDVWKWYDWGNRSPRI